eukprot:m.220241 g.220241  ORF g.220241 m.220241 type:complete len:504 (+) comp10343_c0_seq1:1945-3456(+)
MPNVCTVEISCACYAPELPDWREIADVVRRLPPQDAIDLQLDLVFCPGEGTLTVGACFPWQSMVELSHNRPAFAKKMDSVFAKAYAHIAKKLLVGNGGIRFPSENPLIDRTCLMLMLQLLTGMLAPLSSTGYPICVKIDDHLAVSNDVDPDLLERLIKKTPNLSSLIIQCREWYAVLGLAALRGLMAAKKPGLTTLLIGESSRHVPVVTDEDVGLDALLQSTAPEGVFLGLRRLYLAGIPVKDASTAKALFAALAASRVQYFSLKLTSDLNDQGHASFEHFVQMIESVPADRFRSIGLAVTNHLTELPDAALRQRALVALAQQTQLQSIDHQLRHLVYSSLEEVWPVLADYAARNNRPFPLGYTSISWNDLQALTLRLAKILPISKLTDPSLPQDLLKLLETDIADRNERKRTLLHRAVVRYDKCIVGRLLERGSRVDARDQDGNTPLHLAATASRRCYTQPPDPDFACHEEEHEIPGIHDRLDVVKALLAVLPRRKAPRLVP